MNKIFTKVIFVLCLLLATGVTVHAQSTLVSGTVTDKITKEPIPGASVTVKGKTVGASTDAKGQFSFTTTDRPPFTITVSYVGYNSVERELTGASSNLVFELETGAVLGQEVVISASRTPERILESPVSVERINAAAIKEIPAPSFYDALSNLKGVEMSTQSMTFKSVNSRGFNANGNVRFNQYIDGMDNQAPGLNFSVGNIVGLTELDVDNVELLPGAASALYGAGGINGTLLMTSKNPFQYQGVSFQYKTGINHVNDKASDQGIQEFKELNVRIAKSWNRFGFKTSFGFLQARDWTATNNSNFDRTARTIKGGDRNSDPNYDGVNVYGDEINANLTGVAQTVAEQTRAGIFAASGGLFNPKTALDNLPAGTPYASYIGFINANVPAPLRPAVINQYLPFYYGLRNPSILGPNTVVSRTGYAETDLVDYDTKSLKTSTSLHYKLTNTVEAIAQANWGTGTSIYTGTDRYSLRNFKIGQYKLELKGQDFFLRAYTTQERSGDAYNATILGSFLNEAYKPSRDDTNPQNGWFFTYLANYLGANAAGQTPAAAHQTARSVADRNRLIPGTAAFETAKNTIVSKPIGPQNGAKFQDRTNLYHYEGMYNLSSALNNVVDLQVGASYRDYFLHSDGTIFDDATRDITIGEYGAFVQLGKKFGESFKMTVAGRYDKSQNFEGRITPRVTGVWTVAKNNNIRASFQTGYRNPTTQDQYIDLAVAGGSTRLIAGLPESINKYNLNSNKAVTAASYRAFMASVVAGTQNNALLQQYTFDPEGLRPESVKSFEVGYKGLATSRLLIDTYVYYNIYNDFIGGIDLYQNPLPTQSTVKYSVPVNIDERVKAWGAAFGLDYQVGKFNFNGNTSYNKLSDVSPTFDNNFNTPEWRFNAGVGSREIVKNLGFNVQYRWQDEFLWNSSFSTGIVPAYSTFDAQVNFKVPSVNSVIKLGGSNILNKYYVTSFGNPSVGALYYLSLTFNP